MAKGFYKALNIESGEETSVMLLIFQSVFLGIFYGTFDISAHTLFLEEFEQAMIPRAFLVSGLVGIVMTSIYAGLQSRVRFSSFAILNLLLVALLTVMLRFGFGIIDSHWVVFVLFVMMGPLNIIALLGFWGTVGRIFTLRQGKRLFGLIDTGQIVGIIVSSYAIPLLLSLNLETVDLLYISAVSIVVALLFQVFISGRIPARRQEEESAQESESGASLAAMFRSRYIGLMSLFVVLLISVTIFVHFSFLGVAKETYPEHHDLAAFFGYFNGTMMVFSILIKTFVYARLVKTWGLRLALILSPVLLFVFTIVAAVIGGVFGLAASFTMFFLVISVSKLFTKSLQDSIVAPSMKILYQSLDAKIRYGVQARIDGTINEISVLASSLLAAGLVALSFFSLVHYSYVLILLLIAWAFVAYKLYQAYRNSLNNSLATFRQTDAGQERLQIGGLLAGDLESTSLPSVRKALGFMERTDFHGFMDALKGLLQSASDKIRRLSLSRIEELQLATGDAGMEKGILKENKGKNRDLAATILQKLEQYRSRKPDVEDLLIRSKSARREERLEAAHALFQLKDFKHHAVLNTLLRDPDPLIRTTAIRAAAHWKVPDACPVLIDYLSTDFYRQAFDGLIQIGEAGVESLEQSYYKSGIEQKTLNRVTRILGRIGSPEAIRSLLGKINYQNRKVETTAVASLLKLEYQADEAELPRIVDGVRTSVHQIAWNLAALYTIQENNLGGSLEKAFQEELKISYDRLYNLLGLAYEPNTIHHIRNNLESGTSEGIGFAIELLDLFVAEEIKPVLFPVLEDTSTVEKIRQLQVEFPIVIMEPYELIHRAINRDPNLLGSFTRAAAIHALGNLEGVEVSDDLIAQVFHPDPMLSELAALQLDRMDRSVLESVFRRLSPENRARLTRLLREADEGEENMIWDRIHVLLKNEYLSTVNSEILYGLARDMEPVRLSQGQTYKFVETGETARVGLVNTGEFVLQIDGKVHGKYGPGDLIGIFPFMVMEKTLVQAYSSGDGSLLVGSQSLIDEMMFDHEEMALVMYRWLGQQDREGLDTEEEMVS